VRMPTGAGTAAGPFHSQSNEAWFFHTPGLKILYPSNRKFPVQVPQAVCAQFKVALVTVIPGATMLFANWVAVAPGDITI